MRMVLLASPVSSVSQPPPAFLEFGKEALSSSLMVFFQQL
jgi:hypothetical protein